jgi:hypothetical protein
MQNQDNAAPRHETSPPGIRSFHGRFLPASDNARPAVMPDSEVLAKTAPEAFADFICEDPPLAEIIRRIGLDPTPYQKLSRDDAATAALSKILLQGRAEFEATFRHAPIEVATLAAAAYHSQAANCEALYASIAQLLPEFNAAMQWHNERIPQP